METPMPNRFERALEKYSMHAQRRLFRLQKKITGNSRPGSYPYVSGDSFRLLADHIHDETGTFRTEDVKLGDIIFVANGLTLSYLQKMHPLIKHPYILIEHNGDHPMDAEVMGLLDDKIIRFYAQDAVTDHEKLIPIPLALENLHFYINGIPGVFDKMRKDIARRPPIRKNKIFFFFNVGTNPAERGPAKEYFLKHPAMETVTGMLAPRLHLKKLSTYKFVASPPGNAIESCRTFEALYLKTIPIVKDFVSMRYFVSLGLPIWIVKDWHELDAYGERELTLKYDALMKGAVWDALFMDFWIKKIREDQRTARAKNDRE
jgi:hypothetical protein